jgi:hypothetical protein
MSIRDDDYDDYDDGNTMLFVLGFGVVAIVVIVLIVYYMKQDPECTGGFEFRDEKCQQPKCTGGFEFRDEKCQQPKCTGGFEFRDEECQQPKCTGGFEFRDEECQQPNCTGGFEFRDEECQQPKCSDGQVFTNEACAYPPCSGGLSRVGDKCLRKLQESKGVYTGDKISLYKCKTGWCADRWMLSVNGAKNVYYSNPKGAMALGDITDWRTTNTNTTQGDKKVPKFNIVSENDKYYLPARYVTIMDDTRKLYKK